MANIQQHHPEPFPDYLGPNHIDMDDIPIISQYAFSLFDKGNTGVLSRAEIVELHRALRMMSVLPEQCKYLTEEGMEGIEQLVALLDIDQDGRVTQQDFEAFINKYIVNSDISSSKNGIIAGFERNMDAERILNSGETILD